MSEYENNEDVRFSEPDVINSINGISECANEIAVYLEKLKDEGKVDFSPMKDTIEAFGLYVGKSGWIDQFIKEYADSASLKQYWIELKAFQPVCDLLSQMTTLTLGWIQNGYTIINAKLNADKSNQYFSKDNYKAILKDFSDVSSYVNKSPGSINNAKSTEFYNEYIKTAKDPSNLSVDLKTAYFLSRIREVIADIKQNPFFNRIYDTYKEGDMEKFRLKLDIANTMKAVDGYIAKVKEIETNGDAIDATRTLCKTILQQKIEPRATIPAIIQLGDSITNMVKILQDLSEYCFDLYEKFLSPDDDSPFCYMNKAAVIKEARGHDLDDINEDYTYEEMYFALVNAIAYFISNYTYCHGDVTTSDRKYSSKYCR